MLFPNRNNDDDDDFSSLIKELLESSWQSIDVFSPWRFWECILCFFWVFFFTVPVSKFHSQVASRDGGQLYVGSSAQMGPKDGQSYSKQEKTSETAPSSWKNCPSIEETVHSNDIQIQTSVNINTETHGKDSRCWCGQMVFLCFHNYYFSWRLYR